MTALERIAINVSTLLVGVSGLVYAYMKYLMTNDDPFSVVNHPLQPWILDLHILAGPALIFAVGWIARDHIIAKARNRNGNGSAGRGSGFFALICFLPMVSTGYLIQVFTNDTARMIAVVIHLATGIAYLLVYAAHLIVSRSIAAKRRARAQIIAREGAPRAGLLRTARPPAVERP